MDVALNLPLVLGGLDLESRVGVDVPVTLNEVVAGQLGSKLVGGEGPVGLKVPVVAVLGNLGVGLARLLGVALFVPLNLVGPVECGALDTN